MTKKKTAESKREKVIKKFKNHILNGPEIVCVSCGCLFFVGSVFVLSKVEDRLNRSNVPSEKIKATPGTHICRRCFQSIVNDRVPKVSLANGLKFPDVPESVLQLSDVEERMVTPIIPFMQIRALLPHALNPQLSLKGSVVHIVMNLNNVLEQILPRPFDKMNVILLKFKRNMQHVSNYLFETIRPYKIIEALQDLLKTPLYENHNISIDENFFLKYKDNPNISINFAENEAIDFLTTQMKNLSFNDKSSILNANNVDVDESDDSDNDLYGSENEEIEEVETTNDEILIQSNDELYATETQVTLAPGENNRPIPWHTTPDIEELCHPKIYGGRVYNLEQPISYFDRAKSEILRYDRRCCTPQKLLYMARKLIEQKLHEGINIAVRLSKSLKLTASDIDSPNILQSLFSSNSAYSFLQKIRISPAFWELKKKELLAMIRQLGKPTLFLTLSGAEKRWPELLKCLYKNVHKKEITLEDAIALSEDEKTFLIQQDPVTCARYFEYKIRSIFDIIFKSNEGPFKDNKLIDYYYRTEFQSRGSPHIHAFLWLENAPIFSQSSNNYQEVINFIDNLISVEYSLEVDIQFHHHTFTCYKKKVNKIKKTCRFKFPRPIIDETTILFPLDEISDETRSNYERIQEALKSIDMKKHLTELPFQLDFFLTDYLNNMSKEEYFLALSSSLKTETIFHKRNSHSIFVNNYSKIILPLINSNMDIQFVTNEFAVASYIVNYISKVNTELTRNLRNFQDVMKHSTMSMKNALYKIASVFTNYSVICAQEAVYLILALPFSVSSRASVFINTQRPEERVKLVKSSEELSNLAPNSVDIYKPDTIDLYAHRDPALEKLCLADFVASVKDCVKASARNSDQPLIDSPKLYRKSLKIIRSCNFRENIDESEFYRELIMLYLPWRNEESEVLNINHKEKFFLPQVNDIIMENRAKYNNSSCSTFDFEALNLTLTEKENHDQSIDGILTENLDNYEVSIEAQFNVKESSTPKSRSDYVFKQIPMPALTESNECIINTLNNGQKKFALQILHNYRTTKIPFFYFLGGSAGTGKSYLVKSLIKLVTQYFNTLPGEKCDVARVLSIAPTGKAAHLIRGNTIHSAFALPINQFSGIIPQLSSEIAASLRNNFIHLKLIILDEVSMVGKRLLAQLNTRLKQIMGNNKDFGGLPVIIVGDIKQLSPVRDSALFSSKNLTLQNLGSFRLWRLFKYYELTEIMRQSQDEIDFIKALNNLGLGQLTDEDVDLFNSRNYENNEENIPFDAIHLLSTNVTVDALNLKILNSLSDIGRHNIAVDTISGNISNEQRSEKLKIYATKPKSETQNLTYDLHLKISGLYMIGSNIDIQDGLVNGTVGVLKGWETKNDDLLYLLFDFFVEEIGKEARLSLQKKDPNFDSNELTPIFKVSHQIRNSFNSGFTVTRCQFPVFPCHAMTIYKAQGSTFIQVCVHINKLHKITAELLYVAFSRAKSLNGLFLVGSIYKKIVKPNKALLEELTRLNSEALLRLPLYECYKSGLFTIFYHNVRTLNGRLNTIVNDPLYSQHNIIIFSESRIVDPSKLQFQEFKLQYSSINTSRSKSVTGGLICASREKTLVIKSKTQVQNKFKLPNLKRNKNLQKNLELVLLKENGVYILTGYVSPGFELKIFRFLMKKMLAAIPNNAKVVVIGDFNYDYLSENGKKVLERIFANSKFNLKSVLPSEFTTIYNSQLDIIFTNLEIFNTGIYTTCFSDHYPVYIQMPFHAPSKS